MLINHHGQIATHRVQNCWFCCNCSSRPHHPMKDAEDFAKSLVTQASTDVGKYHPENMPLIQKGPGDVCWLICGNKPIKCPKGWVSAVAHHSLFKLLLKIFLMPVFSKIWSKFTPRFCAQMLNIYLNILIALLDMLQMLICPMGCDYRNRQRTPCHQCRNRAIC